MAIAEWPSSLPDKPLRDGFAETHPKMIIRTNMDKGPAKVRRLTSKAPRVFDMSFHMTNAQVSTFETFIADALAEGVYRFSWTHPRTEESVEFRLLPEQDGLYAITPLGGNYWEIFCRMEILP